MTISVGAAIGISQFTSARLRDFTLIFISFTCSCAGVFVFRDRIAWCADAGGRPHRLRLGALRASALDPTAAC
eukprot:5865863-Pleurochrysis_carterae.AAC.1